MARSRKHAWLRDELVLALDLYVRSGKRADTTEREELSALLRRIPIEQDLTADPGFRGEKAVSYKLHNFVHLDPADPTVGFPNGGAGDRAVWNEFAGDSVRLARAAEAIRASVERGALPAAAGRDDDDLVDAPEGRLLTRAHRVRERSRALVERKKAHALTAHGRLACEACGFDFAAVYGERGHGFAECHHLLPVSELRPHSRTRLEELALLCANCHRMIHRRSPWLTLAELRALIAEHARPRPVAGELSA